jgi:branched-chain amino acid transport system substrate-binding protein
MQPLLDNGDRIELIIKDSLNDPVKAPKVLRELVEIEQVAAVVTFSSSGPVLAMANVADAYQTPILVALATHPDVTKNNNYVSQICFDNIFQGQVAALFVRDELLVDRVVVFKTPSSFYSSNLAAEFEGKFTSLGGLITDVIALPDEPTDVAAMLKGVRDKDPELLYLPIAARDVIAIIREIDRMGWQPRLMGSDGLLATVISQHENYLSLLDGILATELFHHSSQLTRFGERARDVHEGQGTSFTALGVEGFAILLDAMNRCDDPADRECINRQIRSTSNFEGLLGKISIDLDGKAHRPVVINTIKDKKTKYIVKVY